MKINTMYSTKGTVQDAIGDLREQYQTLFADEVARLVIFFSSSNFDAYAVSEHMKGIFPDADVVGCTTAGELVSGLMLKNSIVALVFDKESAVDVAVSVVENLKEGVHVDEAFKSFEGIFGLLKDVDLKKHVGIVLVDGLSGAEESVMDRIGDLTNITFIGGAAGDDVKFEKTFVFANGKTYTNAAVLVLIKLEHGFDVIKTQSFNISGDSLVATKVDEAKREVIEFNGRPAAEVYAEKLNTTVEKAGDEFMSHPVGLLIDKEPYVRSPQQVIGNKMKFYCNVKEGTNLSILDSTDIVEETEKVIADKIAEIGQIRALVNFHCILRTLELEKKGQTEAYGKIFAHIPMIGFSTYGEEYIGHINQTSTILVLK